MPLYELRTYTLRVGTMAEAVKHYQEIGFPALQKGSHEKKLIGYFQADTGTINQIVHLWKFDDDADRRAHWAALYANKDFVEGFAAKFRPLEAASGRTLGAASLVGRARGCRPIYFKLQARRAALSPPSDRAVKAFGEPALDRSEKLVCLIPLALIAPQPRRARRGAKFLAVYHSPHRDACFRSGGARNRVTRTTDSDPRTSFTPKNYA
jgi:hypothetical protein